MKVDIVPIDDIEVGERFRVDMGNLVELAESIKNEGIIQPLAVYNQPNGEKPYLLLAGGRRYAACKMAGLDKVPVRVYDHELTLAEQRSIELAENLYRKNLEWQEQARLAREIYMLQKSVYGDKISTSKDAGGWSVRDTAKFIGRSVGTVSEDIRLAEMVEKVPELLECRTREEAVKKMQRVVAELTLAERVAELEKEISSTPLEVQRSNIIASYIVGDFFTNVKSVPDRSIDLVEIDPPFGIDLDDVKKGDSMESSYYHEVDKRNYINFIREVVEESWRVLSNDGWLLMWFGPDPWFQPVLEVISRTGFNVKGLPALWIKQVGQTMRPDLYLGNAYEMFFYARKGNATIKKQGRLNIFVYPVIPPQKKVHPTEKPIELLQDILSTFADPGSRILVPFLGSGNTLLAAYNLKMQAFGYDLSNEYRDTYVMKAASGKPGSYSSL